MNLVNRGQEKSQMDLIKIAFKNLNAFKRVRALENIEKGNKDYNKAQYYKLRQYELIDELELALRAIQSGQRNLEDDNEG